MSSPSSLPRIRGYILEHVDKQGCTLPPYVAYAGFPSVVDILLKSGAKPSIFREYVTYGKQYRKDRLRTDIKHKTPQDEMLYRKYLWQYTSHAIDMEFRLAAGLCIIDALQNNGKYGK